MLTTRNHIAIAGLTVGLLAVSAAVRASTITQVFNIPATATSFTAPFTYNLFDSTLGTLTGVTLDLTTSGTPTVDVLNFTGSAQPFTAATSVPISVTGPPGTTTYISSTLGTGTISGIVSASATVFPGEAFNGPTVNADSGPVPVLPNTIWPGNWEGVGLNTSTLHVNTGAETINGAGATGLFFGGSAVVGGSLTLTYNFNPPSTPGTPEPGAWALLVATASVSVAGLRKRRMTK
jgi:hypothetical protein